MKKNQKDKTRILVCGDSLNQVTGFSYVISSIITRLQNTGQYEISYTAFTGIDTTTDGLKIQSDDFYKTMRDNMRIFNTQVTDHNKAKGLDKVIEEVKPQIVLTSHDPWNLDMIAYSAYKDSFYWVAYLTVETPEYPSFVMSSSPILPTNRKPVKEILSRANLIIPHTSMGYDMLTKHMDLTNVSKPCYSGVDFETRCTEEVSKREAFGESANESDFIFMTMGFNSERKKIDKVVEAFWVFKKKYPEEKYKLYLHTDLNANTGGTDIRGMVSELGLMDSVLVSTSYRAGVGIDKKELYRRYKASDCYISLPAGEGLGYGVCEAMMHGKPIIYINYGGHTCYCKPAGLPVKVKTFVHAKNAFIKWAIADVDDAAKAMGRMVSDRHLRESSGKKGVDIIKNNMDWTVVFPKFHNIMLSEYKAAEISTLAGVPMKRIV